MRRASIIAISVMFMCAAQTASAKGEFSGKLGLHPNGCEETRKCYLDDSFHYKDSHSEDWEAQKDDETDGASIPWWAQSTVGLPFDRSFIKAAVIHDHYCNRHVRPMLKTHWVFYDALLASGVSSKKAKIMYAAILIGGPKWISLIPGKPCKKGAACVQSVSELPLPAGAARGVADDGKPIIYRDANYDNANVKAAIEDVTKMIEANPESVSEESLEKIAGSVPGNELFFNNLDGIVVAPSNGIKE
jgi:hypothetical protein